MQFMVLGKYSNQGLAGFIQNPNDDRRAAISSMMEKAGGKLIDLHLTSCLLYTSPSPRDRQKSRMPSSA